MSLRHAFDLERPAVRAGVGLALLLLMAVLLVGSSLGKRLVYDEYDNLAYGFRVLTHGPVLPQSGQRMPILALSALGCLSPCRENEVNATEAGRLLVRLPTIVFTLALGLVLWGWAAEWLGPRPALLALALYALHPTVLAHGKQVTTDVHAAFFTAAALWPVWRIFRRRGDGRVNLVLAAAATTGALVSKYTSVLLLPILALAVVGETWRARREGARLRSRRIAVAVTVFALLVLLFLNAAYLFEGTLRRADSYPWRSRALQFLSSVPLPLPLPRAFVRGVDFSFQVQEEPGVGRGYNYVLGQLNTDGVWYAFPLMLLLKTPLAVFALAFLAWRWRPEGEGGRGGWTWLAAPLAVFLAFFGLLVKPQLGIRYLLPVLPLLILGAARASAAAVTPSRRRLVAIVVVWAAVSALSYHPHYMSYFNEPIGPRVNAYRFLADSNLDWEDRTADIARFRAEHPEILLVVEPEAPQAGWILVGANKLVGVYKPERYRWLRENLRPERHVGYSYLLFRVTPERLQEIQSRVSLIDGSNRAGRGRHRAGGRAAGGRSRGYCGLRLVRAGVRTPAEGVSSSLAATASLRRERRGSWRR